MTQTDPAKTVFISYRRSINWAHARLVFDELRKRGYDVFMDVENLGAGNFERIILQEIRARAHFIVMLSVPALKRCSKPDDWLRREIEYAMDNDRNIVPIRIDSFNFKRANKYLTGKLDGLQKYNGPSLNAEFFDKAIENLVNRFLVQPVYAHVFPPPTDTQNEVSRIIEDVAAQPEPTREELSAETLFIRAFEKLENGDLDGAITDYSEAIRLNPDFADGYLNRGAARSEKNDLIGAIEDFDKALGLRPDADVYYNRGAVRGLLGDLNGAIADYDEAIQLQPDDDKARNNRGVARGQLGDLEGAIEDFDEVLRLNPDNAEAYNNRGATYAEKGDFARAFADYSAAISLRPDLVQPYFNQAMIHEQLGNFAEAIEDYSKALTLIPNDADVYSNRGEAYFNLGEYFQALQDFFQAKELNDNSEYALSGIAVTQYVLGNVDSAQGIWRDLLARDERYTDADWVGIHLNWAEQLVEEARKLIASLNL
jgi:tetratricopeptide (TPR) repeat protein